MIFSQISHFSLLIKCFVPKTHNICTYAIECLILEEWANLLKLSMLASGVKTWRKRCINYHSFSEDNGTIQLITKSTALLLLSLCSSWKQVLTRMNTKLTTQEIKPNHKWDVINGLLEILVLTPKCFISILTNAPRSALMRPAGWAERPCHQKKRRTPHGRAGIALGVM